MKSFVQMMVGLLTIGLVGYTLVMSILIVTENTDTTFDDISFQLGFSLVLAAILIFGFISDRRNQT